MDASGPARLVRPSHRGQHGRRHRRGTGAVAWAQVYGEVSRIWTTADGRSWERATVEAPTDADPSMEELGFISSIIAGGPGYVAVGYYQRLDTGRRGVVWTSVDGRKWDLAPFDATFESALISSVIAWRGELLAYGVRSYGADEGQGEQLAWSSSDGLTWKAVDLSIATGLRRGAPIVGGDRLWASGEPDGVDAIASWKDSRWPTSTDGRTWSVATLPYSPGYLYPVSAGMISLAQPSWMTGPDAGDLPTPGVYRSEDFSSWDPVSEGDEPFGDLIEVGSTLVVVGDDSDADSQCPDACRPVGWRSADGGVTWARVAADDVNGTMLTWRLSPMGRSSPWAGVRRRRRGRSRAWVSPPGPLKHPGGLRVSSTWSR